MLKFQYFDKTTQSGIMDFFEQAIRLFEHRHGLKLTVHAMNSRWYSRNGGYLFSRWIAHHAKFCERKRYANPKYNRACMRDCAVEVEQESLRTGEPFLHNCWKGVTELIVPFLWEGTPELIFYLGPFRGSEPPEEFRSEWENLPLFPREKQENLILETQLLGLGFHARLLQENRTENPLPNRRERIREYILRHACEKISLSGLGHALGISESRASHLCMLQLGASFQDLVLRARMKKAELLLRETDEPIKAIAEKTGYPNIYYFSRMFRRFFHESPARFRRNAIR